MWLFRAPEGERYPKTAVHAHHVLQLTFALTGQVRFEHKAQHVTGEAVAVAPDAPHAFEGTGLIAHLFVASDSKPGRALTHALCAERPLALIPSARIGDFRARLRETFADTAYADDELRALGRGLIAKLVGEGPPADTLDPRVARVIAWSAARLDQALSLRDILPLVGLSSGRARHLFVEQTGLSFRTYLLWLRLERAVRLFAEGASLTEAAHGAGFSDSAHLSRTFRRMFGIAAASLRVA